MTGLQPLALALLGIFGLSLPALACPFCTQELGRTMVDDYGKATLVMTGTFSNPRIKGEFNQGVTDFHIDAVLKSNPLIKGRTMVTLPKHVNQPKVKFLLFCDVYKKEIDAYRADPIPEGSALVSYLAGAIKLRDRPLPERLPYYVPFLNSKEFEISLDAYREFAMADYKDYRDLAAKLDPAMLKGWLEDPKTPTYRFGLYGSLLGHCGKGSEYGTFLRGLIENTNRHKGSGLDGLLVGYVLAQPKEGWQYVAKDYLANPKGDFNSRYAALRALRFLWSYRPEVVGKDALVQAMLTATEFPDVADFAVGDLRKWQCWQTTDQVLALVRRKTHDVGVIRREVLRFALQSPTKAAAAYVAQQRRLDPEQVRDTEDILKLESDVPAAPTR